MGSVYVGCKFLMGFLTGESPSWRVTDAYLTLAPNGGPLGEHASPHPGVTGTVKKNTLLTQQECTALFSGITSPSSEPPFLIQIANRRNLVLQVQALCNSFLSLRIFDSSVDISETLSKSECREWRGFRQCTDDRIESQLI